MKAESGIYLLCNLVNNKVYVGSAVYIYGRINHHTYHLTRNIHHNKYLQNSWNKYGEANFKFYVLEVVQDKAKLAEREQYWIDRMCCLIPAGYNICPLAVSPLGFKHTEESKKKMSAWQIGRKMSDEAKANMSKARTGTKILNRKPFTDEHKQKLKDARKGIKFSEEHKKKLRAVSKLRFKKLKAREDYDYRKGCFQ